MDAARHLIHVGFPKAGSNFIEAWGLARADVAFMRGGVAGFARIQHLSEAAGPQPRLYLTSGRTMVVGVGPQAKGTLYSEARVRSPLDLLPADVAERQRRACTTLHTLFPQAHVLIVVRGFESMCRSMVAQTIKRGWAWADADAGPFLARAAGLLDYDRVVGLYEEAFGPDHVHVLPYERLREDPEGFIQELCAAGAVPPQRFGTEPVNASPGPQALGLIRAVSGGVRPALAPLPSALYERLSRLYSRALARVAMRPWFERLGGWAGVAPLAVSAFSADQLRAAFAGRAEAVARRPAVAPYAGAYSFSPPVPGDRSEGSAPAHPPR